MVREALYVGVWDTANSVTVVVVGGAVRKNHLAWGFVDTRMTIERNVFSYPTHEFAAHGTRVAPRSALCVHPSGVRIGKTARKSAIGGGSLHQKIHFATKRIGANAAAPKKPKNINTPANITTSFITAMVSFNHVFILTTPLNGVTRAVSSTLQHYDTERIPPPSWCHRICKTPNPEDHREAPETKEHFRTRRGVRLCISCKYAR